MTTMTEVCAIYVAYRRPDAQRVRTLLAVLSRHLGRPPDWAERWFYFDLEDLSPGRPWLFEITEAHRRAALILGVLSKHSVVASREEAHAHNIYFDELRRAADRGRLIPILLDDVAYEDLMLGIAGLQIFSFESADALPTRLLAEIGRRTALAKPKGPPTAARLRWARIRQDLGLHDLIDDVSGWDRPLVLRPVLRSTTEKPVMMTAEAVTQQGCRLFDAGQVEEIFRSLHNSAISYRLPWPDEAVEIFQVPEVHDDDWSHPFDLAISPDSPPIWVARPDNSLAVITPHGDSLECAATAALWLAVVETRT